MTESNRTEGVLEVLRRPAADHAVFRGFGPLVVGVLFLLLMVALLPSVAPEQIVVRPADGPAAEAEE